MREVGFVNSVPPKEGTKVNDLPIAIIRPFEGRPKYVHVAEVSTSIGGFPEDMLRYDGAFLCDPDQDEDPCDEMGRCTFRPVAGTFIYKVSDFKTPPWAVGRWQSFCCSLRHCSTQKLERP